MKEEAIVKDAWIDVSVPIRSGMVVWPNHPPVRIDRVADRGKGDICTHSWISLGSHTGTHLDAPLHFLPGGKALEDMPLSTMVGPARVLEIGTPSEVLRESLRPHRIRRGERILLKTGNSARCWKTDSFLDDYVGVSLEAAAYLAERRVDLIGIDYLSIAGFHADAVSIHETLLGAGVWILEGLNLSCVTPGRYQMICLPLNLAEADGAPARVLLRPVKVGRSKSPPDRP